VLLEKLVDRPIALRRCDGETWEMIEEDLKVIQTEEGVFETKMSEFIDLRLIDECKDPEEWVRIVSLTLKDDPEMVKGQDMEKKVEEYIERKRNDGELIWSGSLGSMVSV